MYRIDDVGSFYTSLPPNLQTVENDCLGYAIDRQFAKLYRIAQSLTVWSDLDNADPKYYDQLAMTIRAPYYKSEYRDAVKLDLIKSALKTRKYAGSGWAIDELIAKAFKYASYKPWYEYGGTPYHMKIFIKQEPGSDSKQLFKEMIKKVKAARTVLDEIEMDGGRVTAHVHIGLGLLQEKTITIHNMEML